MDIIKGWYKEDCDFVERGDYGDEDPIYEGGYDLWEDCGPNAATVVVVAARPRNDPLSHLTLVQVQMLSDADVDAFGGILDTFDKVGRLP